MPSPALALLVAALTSPLPVSRAWAGPGPEGSNGTVTPAIEGPGPHAAASRDAAIDPALRIRSGHVDPRAVQQGLELRVGPGWRRWAIEVDDGREPAQVDVRLRDAAGRIHARSLTLEGQTVDERSRALASSLALLVEQLETSAPPGSGANEDDPPGRSPRPGASSVAGFLAMGPRMALDVGGPPHVDGGASLTGGAWLVREHVVPVGELAWARSTAGTLVVDALRLGGGVLGGAATARGRLWGGGGVLMRAQWAQARDTATAAGWWASPAVIGALQYRGRILVVGGWLGADLMLPPLRARGDAHTLRWSVLRPMVALHVGLRLPPRR